MTSVASTPYLAPNRGLRCFLFAFCLIPAFVFSAVAAHAEEDSSAWVKQNATSREYTFFVLAMGQDNSYAAKGIRVVSRTTGNVIQEISDIDSISAWGQPEELLSLVDANFDGHPDIVLDTFTGSAANYSRNFYLFNPRNERFELSKELSELPDADVGPNGSIITAFRDGCCHHIEETYRYIHGKLTLVASRDEMYRPDERGPGKSVIETTTGKRIKGKMRYKTTRRLAPKGE